jgi:hypothetical protein
MTLHPVTKILLSLGILLISAGIFFQWGSKWVNWGHLPGDLFIKKEKIQIYFPLTTSLLISVILSAILYLIQFFGKKS